MPDQPALFDGLQLPPGPHRLLNLLRGYPGTEEAKWEWLQEELPLMVLEVEALGLATERQRNAKLASLVIRWWRAGIRRSQQSGPETFDERSERESREWAKSL